VAGSGLAPKRKCPALSIPAGGCCVIGHDPFHQNTGICLRVFSTYIAPLSSTCTAIPYKVACSNLQTTVPSRLKVLNTDAQRPWPPHDYNNGRKGHVAHRSPTRYPRTRIPVPGCEELPRPMQYMQVLSATLDTTRSRLLELPHPDHFPHTQPASRPK